MNYSKVLNGLISLRDLFLKMLGRTDYETIYFEGGLGAQILAYIEFIREPRRIDLSYFRHPPAAGNLGPDIWNWELGRYGIELDSFQKYENLKPFNPWKTRRPSTKETVDKVLKSNRVINSHIEQKFRTQFPMNKAELQKTIDNLRMELESVTTVHIRRGDYERVSSKIIGLSDYVNFIKTISKNLTKDVIFLSDSTLSNEDIELLESQLPDKRVIFLSNKELSPGTSHDLMRCSKILITANSTFSISAGLLSEPSTLVFSPILFFGGENGYINSRIFNQNGDFFIMRKYPEL